MPPKNTLGFLTLTMGNTGRRGLVNLSECVLAEQTGDLESPTALLFASGLGVKLSVPFETIRDLLAGDDRFRIAKSDRSGREILVNHTMVQVMEQTMNLELPTKILFSSGISVDSPWFMDELTANFPNMVHAPEPKASSRLVQ